MTSKDWATLTVSAVALLISATTLYFSVVRTKDDLRVVVEGTPSFLLDYDHPRFDVITNLTMTFINVGNRPAAILGVTLYLDQSPAAELHQENCEHEGGTATTRPYNLNAVIVKAGEIVSVSTKLHDQHSGAKEEERKIRTEEWSVKKNQINVLGCLRFTVSTPDDVSTAHDVSIFYSQIELFQKEDGYFGAATTPSLGPHILLKKTWPM
jgi:hypothetical protein